MFIFFGDKRFMHFASFSQRTIHGYGFVNMCRQSAILQRMRIIIVSFDSSVVASDVCFLWKLFSVNKINIYSHLLVIFWA